MDELVECPNCGGLEIEHMDDFYYCPECETTFRILAEGSLTAKEMDIRE